MRRSRRCAALLVAIAGLVAGGACSQTPGQQAPAATGWSSSQARIPGEYLVTLAAGAEAKAIEDTFGRFGIRGTRQLGRDTFLVTLTEDPGPVAMEELGRKNEAVRSVQPNFDYRGTEGQRQVAP